MIKYKRITLHFITALYYRKEKRKTFHFILCISFNSCSTFFFFFCFPIFFSFDTLYLVSGTVYKMTLSSIMMPMVLMMMMTALAMVLLGHADDDDDVCFWGTGGNFFLDCFGEILWHWTLIAGPGTGDVSGC